VTDPLAAVVGVHAFHGAGWLAEHVTDVVLGTEAAGAA
jgi:hypothetical protein